MTDTSSSRLIAAAQQTQFLRTISRDEAEQRFQAHLRLQPCGVETIPLHAARGRVLARDTVSDVDVPAFDRSNVDGFALRAADTSGVLEESPRVLSLNSEILSPGIEPKESVAAGSATTIATGGMLPRGADCVVMVEHTRTAEGDFQQPQVIVNRAATPGQFVTFAGTDIARGEAVLSAGQLISSREIGVLAAIGRDSVDVYRKPRVAVISTGDEIVAPGQPLKTGCVYDSNSHIVAAALEELGCEPVVAGVVADDEPALEEIVRDALECDAVILSGGTSKGAGDLSYRVVGRLRDPGIVAHGVALKPGKPICLAVTRGKPVVILPGFPTSAIFTFHEFVAPVLRAFAGLPPAQRESVSAVLPHRINSERGRTEYLLVGLVRGESGLSAYPLGKGSGSVTTFSLADGFITIDQHTEIVDAGSPVRVTLLDRGLRAADLVVMGSHCVGLDYLLGELRRRGLTVKSMHVGSTGGLQAAQRGECDLAGAHLLDPRTGQYNTPFLNEDIELIPGYRRMQCLVFRRGDPRFAGKSPPPAIAAALLDPGCTMINRNVGSGTRILLDRVLDEVLSTPRHGEGHAALSREQIPGYAIQAKSHNAVAAAIAQGRADWGLCIETVARTYGLDFVPVQDEHYDFLVPRARIARPAVAAFRALLGEASVRSHLRELGFALDDAPV